MQQSQQWAQQAPVQGTPWSWSGLAKQSEKATSREWLGIAGIAVASTLLAAGVGWLSGTGAGLVLVVGYGFLLTRAIGLASRVGPAKPIALDQRGLWFDGSLLYPLASIQRFNLLMTSRASSTDGVGVRAFAGGIQVHSITGKTWFELSVPGELVQLARGLGIHVIDAPGPPGGV